MSVNSQRLLEYRVANERQRTQSKMSDFRVYQIRFRQTSFSKNQEQMRERPEKDSHGSTLVVYYIQEILLPDFAVVEHLTVCRLRLSRYHSRPIQLLKTFARLRFGGRFGSACRLHFFPTDARTRSHSVPIIIPIRTSPLSFRPIQGNTCNP